MAGSAHSGPIIRSVSADPLHTASDRVAELPRNDAMGQSRRLSNVVGMSASPPRLRTCCCVPANDRNGPAAADLTAPVSLPCASLPSWGYCSSASAESSCSQASSAGAQRGVFEPLPSPRLADDYIILAEQLEAASTGRPAILAPVQRQPVQQQQGKLGTDEPDEC